MFGLSPRKAVVNDSNEELVNVYRVVKDDVDTLVELLKSYPNELEFYNTIRALDRDEDAFKDLPAVERAARFIYLNKTCFNGLYRVNKKRQFNASFGKYKNPKICDEDTLWDVSSYLRKSEVELLTGDFEASVESAKQGDFVYFDPPYVPLTVTSSFTRYTSDGFDMSDQVRLRNLVDRLTGKGVFVMLSNSCSPVVKELYADYHVRVVQANRRVNTVGSGRGKINEVLVTNYG